MEFSRFNIVSRIKDSGDYFILNALYGSADIMDENDYRRLMEAGADDAEFAARGYLVDPEIENRQFRESYLNFLDERERDEIQLFFVPGYNCNFDCSYCYQDDYNIKERRIKPSVVDAFFRYIDTNFAHRQKYVTLFGGEPLLPGEVHKTNTANFISAAAKRGIEIAVVTNGYHLVDYFDILNRGGIREIQVTLDGTREVHDMRRRLKNGKGSFDRITEGIGLLLRNDIPVNLRVVVDRDNMSNLPELAEFAIKKGWTASHLFSTQIGRNYELHKCQENSKRLYSRIEMYSELYKMIKEYPPILEFHKPSFSVSRSLHETGKLPAALFDACPGTKTEWALDYTGKIYACTATVGKEGEELGNFFPESFLDNEKVDRWSERDVLSIKQCRDCSLSLLCGGGCAALAKNESGSIYSPDCRPVRELLGMGISAYFCDHE